MTQVNKFIRINISEDLWERFRVILIKDGDSIGDVVTGLIDGYVDSWVEGEKVSGEGVSAVEDIPLPELTGTPPLSKLMNKKYPKDF